MLYLDNVFLKRTFCTLFAVFFPLFASSQTTTTNIEIVTISTTRQSTDLFDQASNFSVVSEDDIALLQHEHINQLFNQIPGGWVSRGNGQEHLTALRSPVLTGAGGCGAFFMAQDGISVRAPGFCNTNQLFDLNTEQAAGLEVIRGPGSVLYGSNAVHGVINLLTPDAFSASPLSMSLELGPHDYSRAKFSLASQSENNALMLYGNASNDGGYKDDSGYDQQKVNLIHQYNNEQWLVKNVFAVSNLNQETAGFIQGFEAYEDKSVKRSNPNPEAFRDSQSARAYSQITYQFDADSSLSVKPYLRWADMQFLQHFLPWQPLEENSQRSIGAQTQYSAKRDNIQYIVGFDWDLTQGKLAETQAEDFAPNLPQGQHYDYQVDAKVYSPFSQLFWSPIDNLTVNLGARFEHTNYDYDNNLSDGSACAVEVDNCRFTRPSDQQISYSQWSYQAGLQYSLAQQQSLYINIANGYRAPQATELFRLQAGQQSTDLDAEEIDSIELGWRAQYHQLFVDVAIFSMEKNNFIFQDTQRQNISNGETSHQGIELSVRYDFTEDWYLKGNATLADHQYESSLTLSLEDIRHNEIDTAPQHMGSAQLGWKIDGQHLVELEWVHVGNYFVNPENTAEYKGHNLINLRSQWQINQQLRLSARLINLTDEDYAERADFGFGNYRYFVGEPRAFYLGLHYRLD
jgi:iron complex outermembrane receptor protein